MDDSDRVTLARIDENVKSLKERYLEDVPPMQQMVLLNNTRITKLERDRRWILGILGVVWAATVAFFDGFWEKFR